MLTDVYREKKFNFLVEIDRNSINEPCPFTICTKERFVKVSWKLFNTCSSSISSLSTSSRFVQKENKSSRNRQEKKKSGKFARLYSG